MRAAHLAAFAVLFACAAAAAQERSRAIPVGAAAISGRVIDAHTQKPLASVTLTLFDLKNGRELITASDASGLYRFDGIAAGAYRISAMHPGYVEYWNGTIYRTSSTTDGVIALGRDEHRERVDFALTRGGTVEGRITDERGAPINNAVIRLILTGGHTFAGTTTSAARTGADGRYTIGEIAAGEYIVVAQVEAASSAGASRIHDTIYYGGVRRAADATRLHVAAGERLREIDVQITRSRVHSLSGRVVSSGALPPATQVTLIASPSGSAEKVGLRSDGTFVIDQARGGRYVLSARARTDAGLFAGLTPVDVSENESDLRIDLEPASRLAGRVVTERGEPLPILGFRIAAVLLDNGADIDPRMLDQTEVASDGGFTLPGLFGERAIRVFGLPQNWELVRVDLARVPVERLMMAPGVDIDNVTVVIGKR
jgi:hypothetical protein